MRTLTLAAVLTVLCGPVTGQTPACAPRDQVVASLAHKYNEASVSRGMTQDGSAIIEVFASPDGETWTILRSMATGVSCIVSAGRGWSFEAVKIAGDPV